MSDPQTSYSTTPATLTLPNLAPIQPQLQALLTIEREMDGALIERNETLRLALIALLAQEHFVLLGPPGTAKSELVTLFSKRITPAPQQTLSRFQWLLTRFTSPDELFGPISVQGLKVDQYRRVTTGKLPEAQLVFLDEIFKCLAGDTLITLSDGSRQPIRTLACYRSDLISMDEHLIMTAQSPAQWNQHAPEPILRLELQTGRTLRATHDHQVLVRRAAPRRQPGESWQDWGAPEWIPLGDIRTHDFVATPREVPIFGNKDLPPHEVDLLALLLADGSCTTPRIGYTKTDPDMVAVAKVAIATAGGELMPANYKYYYTRDPQRKVFDFVQRHGINKIALEKTIPDCVFTLPREQLARFLALLWCGDGTLTNGYLSYASSSRVLIDQVQHLMLRFGIGGRVFHFKTRAKRGGPTFDAYRFTVHHASATRFQQSFGSYAVGAKAHRLTTSNFTIHATDRRLKIEKDVFWDTVVRVEDDGVEESFCFEMSKYPNFVANDIIVHNCSSAVLNALLTILNERAFDNGPTRHPVPLLSLFGASNELPQGDDLAALWDRFALRYVVSYVSDGGFTRLLRLTHPTTPPTTIALSDLTLLQKAVDSIPIPDSLLDAIASLRKDLAGQGIIVSDRRWRTTLKLVRAHALLEERAMAEEDDLAILAHALWTQPEQHPLIARVVARLANPLTARAVELADQAASVLEEAMRAQGDGDDQSQMNAAVEGNSKLKKIIRDLTTLHDQTTAQARNPARVAKALAQVQTMHRQVASLILDA